MTIKIQHVDIQSADAHEPKHITDAVMADAGKVITPSSTEDGKSELRKLDVGELTDNGGFFPTLGKVQSVFGRTGDVVKQQGDYGPEDIGTNVQGTQLTALANLSEAGAHVQVNTGAPAIAKGPAGSVLTSNGLGAVPTFQFAAAYGLKLPFQDQTPDEILVYTAATVSSALPVSSSIPDYAMAMTLDKGWMIKLPTLGWSPVPVDDSANLALKEDKANKGIANGYAPLGSDGKLPDSVIPTSVLGLRQDLADPDKGAAMVGWERQPLLGATSTVGFALSAQAVTPWEYASLITSKPNPNSPATWDWYPAIQTMLNSLQNGQCVSFVGGMTYRVSAPLVVPQNLTGCVFHGNGATIRADHNGDGLVVIATNENFSRHKFYDLNVMGPNVAYPTNAGELAGTSTGAGLKMGRDSTDLTVAAYLASFHNCSFTNFHKGVYLQNALLCNFYGGYITFNQFGIYIDAGQTNANRFFGVSIRENRRVGVYSSGRTGGALTKATNNVFFGCEIETNIPYNAATGGYPATFDNTGVGVGVMLLDSYDFVFDGCYSENHNYGVWIGSSSDDNEFINCRLAQGGAGGFRSDGVMIDGPAVDNNLFRDCKISNLNSVIGNVTITSATSTSNNKFLDCVGFVFEASKLAVQPYIQNNTKSQGSVNGTAFGALVIPPQGLVRNPLSGTSPGQIDGIGTATASLNAYGISEAVLGSQITADTTITAINNMCPGQLLVLSNYQIAHNVTIKSSTDGTSGIVLKGRADVVLSKYGDSITLYCMSVPGGRVVEVGRSVAGLGGIAFTTTARNALTGVRPGTSIFDSTLGKPIWRNAAGTAWVDATGATV